MILQLKCRLAYQNMRLYRDKTGVVRKRIPNLLQKSIATEHEQAAILAVLAQRKSSDRYYQAWIRPNDINIIQRLRDWRPNGEVLAPISLRQKMVNEATQELMHYLPNWR